MVEHYDSELATPSQATDAAGWVRWDDEGCRSVDAASNGEVGTSSVAKWIRTRMHWRAPTADA